MKFALLALLFSISAPATADNFWIPAEKFDKHTNTRMEGALVVDDSTGEQVQLLGNDQQVRIRIGLENNLKQYLEQFPVFEVCAQVANYDSGVTNTVLSKHYNFSFSRKHTLRSNRYEVLCSQRASIDQGSFRIAGVKVISPSQGTLKVRGVLFRSIEDSATSMAVGEL